SLVRADRKRAARSQWSRRSVGTSRHTTAGDRRPSTRRTEFARANHRLIVRISVFRSLLSQEKHCAMILYPLRNDFKQSARRIFKKLNEWWCKYLRFNSAQSNYGSTSPC